MRFKERKNPITTGSDFGEEMPLHHHLTNGRRQATLPAAVGSF